MLQCLPQSLHDDVRVPDLSDIINVRIRLLLRVLLSDIHPDDEFSANVYLRKVSPVGYFIEPLESFVLLLVHGELIRYFDKDFIVVVF